MSLVISNVFTYDEDAGNYIQAVETADGQALESATRKAINNFVIGCKQDGIWDAIKASCILSGARTLAGALVPLRGTAPTNYNFVAGDYDRKTGLVGDGSTKYLDSNRAANADNTAVSSHQGVYISTLPSFASTVSFIGSGGTGYDNERQILRTAASTIFVRIGHQLEFNVTPTQGYLGTSFSGGTVSLRTGGAMSLASLSTSASTTSNIIVFGRGSGSYFSGRLAFYSIGESLDLAKLDGRVTDLINAFGAAIP